MNMFDIREPKYQWGQPVIAAADLINDGSYPDAATDALLVPAGTRGEIVQTGMHEESNTPVYMVEFPGGKVVGCLEDELGPV
jgi:nitrogen fixation protein NifZ